VPTDHLLRSIDQSEPVQYPRAPEAVLRRDRHSRRGTGPLCSHAQRARHRFGDEYVGL